MRNQINGFIDHQYNPSDNAMNIQPPRPMTSPFLGFPVRVLESGGVFADVAPISRQHSLAINDLNERLAAVEVAIDPQDSSKLIDALNNAVNAIQKAIDYLSLKAEENK